MWTVFGDFSFADVGAFVVVAGSVPGYCQMADGPTMTREQTCCSIPGPNVTDCSLGDPGENSFENCLSQFFQQSETTMQFRGSATCYISTAAWFASSLRQ
jgi:hypothetical protein